SFFLILPPIHRSTLFPYTTLFRSSIYCYHSRLPNSLPAMKSQKQLSLAIRESETGQVLTSGTGFKGVSCLLPTLCTVSHHNVFGDRKSTRLNSSHVSISYAVFCLK